MLIEQNKIYNMDCLEGMKLIADKSVDMIICDLPYGVLALKWDKKLSAEQLWSEYNRIIKDNGAIVLTANMKLAIELINANKRWFRYDIIWEKNMPVGFANSNRQPLRSHELILLFYKKVPTYNPQGLIELEHKVIKIKRASNRECAYKMDTLSKPHIKTHTNYPRSVWKYSNDNNKNIHPTQKPLQLFKDLILTYSNEGDTILDNCMGSGTTAIACIETNRNFIGFELDKHYFELANERIEKALDELNMRNN